MKRIILTIAALVLVAGGPALASDLESYGYVRLVEGDAVVTQAESRVDAVAHQPILTGDHLGTMARSRAEVVLPDRNRLRLGGSASVTFDQLAYSADHPATETLLFLDRGELQITVVPAALGEHLPRIDTPNATFYIHRSGSYFFDVSGSSTEVVVRRGSGELVTRDGSAVLGDGEAAWLRGSYSDIDIRVAGPEDSLERWAAALDAEADRIDRLDPVDEGLRYAAAPLASSGTWITHSGRSYWRPAVSASWRPYVDGRWVSTPSGLTWVSYESWGWVPYHYGTWDYLPSYGWAWYPGRTYRPAWVYWYFGPTYTGWCPLGYYWNSYYGGYPPYWAYSNNGSYRWGFGFGIHGWAGGGIDRYDRWSFVATAEITRPRLAGHVRSAHDLRRAGVRELDRGIIATDTRPVRRDLVERPRELVSSLERVARTRQGGDLPNVDDFVARRPDVDRSVVDAMSGRESDGERRLVTRPGEIGDARRDPGSARGRSVEDGRGLTTRPGTVGERGDRSSTSTGVTEQWRDRRPVAPGGESGRSTVTRPDRPSSSSGATDQWRDRRPLAPGGDSGRSTTVRPDRPTVDRGGSSADVRRPDASRDEDWRRGSSSDPPVKRIVDGVRSSSGSSASRPDRGADSWRSGDRSGVRNDAPGRSSTSRPDGRTVSPPGSSGTVRRPGSSDDPDRSPAAADSWRRPSSPADRGSSRSSGSATRPSPRSRTDSGASRSPGVSRGDSPRGSSSASSGSVRGGSPPSRSSGVSRGTSGRSSGSATSRGSSSGRSSSGVSRGSSSSSRSPSGVSRGSSSSGRSSSGVSRGSSSSSRSSGVSRGSSRSSRSSGVSRGSSNRSSRSVSRSSRGSSRSGSSSGSRSSRKRDPD